MFLKLMFQNGLVKQSSDPCEEITNISLDERVRTVNPLLHMLYIDYDIILYIYIKTKTI